MSNIFRQKVQRGRQDRYPVSPIFCQVFTRERDVMETSQP